MGYASQMFIVCAMILLYRNNWSNAQPLSGEENSITPASHGDFSFVVSIQYKKWKFLEGQHLCTGSLISSKHVLTAAQCLNTIDDIQQIEVLAGSPELNVCKKYSLKSITKFKTWAQIKRKAYSTNRLDNNVAILTLNHEVKAKKLQKASFSVKKTKELEMLDVQMAGWGSPSGPIKLCPTLVSANATILTNEGCEDIAGVLKNAIVHVHEEELCVISDRSVKLLKTDSGLPLFYKGNKILGILNGVCPDIHCPEKIFVFTSIYPYREFIQDVLKNQQ